MNINIAFNLSIILLLIIVRNVYTQTAEEYFYRGNLKSDKGDYTGAIEEYTKSIELQPEFSGTYNNRGNSYFALKKYKEAIDDYSKAID